MLQSFGEPGRPEGSVTADVDAPQKNHECHAVPPAARSLRVSQCPTGVASRRLPMLRLVTAVASLIVVVFLQSLDAQPASPGWSPPENLGANVTSSFDDMLGAFLKDRLTLYFTSTRPGGLGGEDLWVSQRARCGDQ